MIDVAPSSVLRAFNKMKSAVSTCQKSFNFINAFACYKRKCKLAPFNLAHTVYTVSQKTCDHIFDDKLNENCPFTKIFGTLISKSIGHRQVFLVSHLTYMVQLLYLENLS